MTGSGSGNPGDIVPLDSADRTDRAGGAPWPHWCYEARLDDAALAKAYESTPAPQRACVKQCLALLHTLWGEDSEENTHSRVDRTLGFAVTRRSLPAPWALFVISAEHNAPTRLAAALLPALLARVPHVAALCVGGMPSTGTRLALELTGIQDIFCTDRAHTVEDLLRGLYSRSGPPATTACGSVALLHHGSLAGVARTAGELHIPLWEEAAAPHIVDATDEERATTRGNETAGNGRSEHKKPAPETLVRLCHPDAFVPTASLRCDAVFGTPAHETPRTLSAPLRVGKGLEGFWLHPSLTPAFFRRHSLHMTPHTGETPWAQT